MAGYSVGDKSARTIPRNRCEGHAANRLAPGQIRIDVAQRPLEVIRLFPYGCDVMQRLGCSIEPHQAHKRFTEGNPRGGTA
ncbi:hypothetical protein CH92_14785 [Stutzerimonas stutzeri]|uniref:Uncharacterized protein n=1 Tax=Stutzerimonas stutzeri TaxID=316 RepID=W8RZT4_STUST|nr:hypothetical protein CH92_14785 [Stutzerimonas stutzeri]